MKYNEQAKLDPSQMGSRGGGNGGKIALGGGAGIVVLILALLFGVNPNDILGQQGSDPQAQPSTTSQPFAQCTAGSDINKDRDCRFVAYNNSIQAYWTKTPQGYAEIQVVPFESQVATACGTATSEVGPFYCPGDTTVYLDLDFFDQLIKDFAPRAGTQRRRTCWPMSSATTSRSRPE